MSVSDISSAKVNLALFSSAKPTSTAPIERQSLPQDGNKLPSDASTPVAVEDVQQLVDEVAQAFEPVSRQLQFQVDKTTGHTVINVIDAETQELVRSIPPEKLLALAHYMNEQMEDPLVGLLMDDRG